MTAGPVVLTGERVTLAAPTTDDIDRIVELCQDPEVSAWTTVPSPYRRSDGEGFVTGMVADGWASGRVCTWGIRAEGALHGVVGLHEIHDGAAEIGFWLGWEARGRGYMSEAVALVLDFAFAGAPSGLGLHRVVWHAIAGNAASAAVARRAGFRFEGTARLGVTQGGVRRDRWQAGMLADDPRAPAGDWPDATFVQLSL
ncbi:acetyltransferase [Leifsonia xyli subsp. cynodontis DSM 46306]|jgi:RimJ/RimL family protein N-acetyltransferase|uniref:N-acetyltransferase domain-containing protein n=1 Tax=Leifsonia xyli subsp. cynodontis DSM 46306 TaxID=1389489 RepID=U3P2U7_LEIXC|nr:GNAT family N-acetyltransferase [Leifsonia xyli]AGW40650.1 acetyltransferase [Leifsonia xyli subsp. cynodontis DSM 46306]